MGFFQKKTNMDGNVSIFKARLVAKGFTQRHCIDYDEAFSPIAMARSIYGLKQASQSWNHRFDEVVKEFGFSQR